MKYILLVVCAIAALQVSHAETDVRETLDKVYEAFEQMGKQTMENFDAKEMKEAMASGYDNMKHQMETVSEKIEKYLADHPDSTVTQARNKMQELINDFKAKNPDVESNLKDFHKSTSDIGEKFVQEMKSAYDKMNTEGGLKDQVTQALNEMGEKMKHTANDIEAKIKEMIEKAQH